MHLPQHQPLVVATRGNAVESVHYGSIAVATAGGEVLWSVGDIAYPVFTRSTLKPIQALPFVAGGGPLRFGFAPAQVALMCGSHSGEPRHVEAVADMLARIDCGVAQLRCGFHTPLFYAATGTTPPSELAPNPLQHNCSGKHAGFLAWCRQHGQPVDGYLDPGHPLQVEIRRTVAHLCDDDGLTTGIDGCGAPNYALPLARLACAYARLAAPVPKSAYAEALPAVFRAMTEHPEMVAGEARADLLLMQAAPGDWVAKGGADGVQALGIRSAGLGIAIKIADGSPRAVQSVLAAVIGQLHLPAADAPALRRWRDGEIRNPAGRLTGRFVPLFRLA